MLKNYASMRATLARTVFRHNPQYLLLPLLAVSTSILWNPAYEKTVKADPNV
jgi:hypothetical protein